jgi:hypothetical protein
MGNRSTTSSTERRLAQRRVGNRSNVDRDDDTLRPAEALDSDEVGDEGGESLDEKLAAEEPETE